MDHPKVNHVSLCAGYGGIDLGLHRVVRGLRTVAYCEIEAFAAANLVAKMEAGHLDAAPLWTDLKTFPWYQFRGSVRVLSGGYPCQPFSAAGKRLGSEDPRHLWPFIRDGIRIMQPDIVFFENVDGHISLGLREVLADLAHLGYRVEGVRGEPAWGVFSASEVGAPHQRKRVFILAHRDGCRGWEDFLLPELRTGGIEQPPGDRRGGCEGKVAEVQAWPARPNEPRHGWEPPRTAANSNGLHRRPPPEGWVDDGQVGHAGGAGPIECSVGRCFDGPSHRLDHAKLHVSCDSRIDELRLLGNGVVPATAARAFTVLMRRFLP